MSVRLYLDVHVPIAIADALRLREVDVLRAQEDGAAELEDPRLLDRATELDRVLFTQDKGFLREANRRQERGEAFSGIVYAHQLNVTIGECLLTLRLSRKTVSPMNGSGASHTCRCNNA